MRSGTGLRTRWAAIGAACAVALGGGVVGVVRANVSEGERTAYFPITPTRVLDTRETSPATNASIKLTVEGSITVVGESSNRSVVPTDASAVAINLTVTGGRKNGDYGYVTAYPCTAASDQPPNASSLNFEDSVDIANALIVTTSANGSICLYVYGTAHLIVDVAGYYADHDHDDRYYTQAQVDNALETLGTELDAKADAVDIYTRGQVDELSRDLIGQFSPGLPTSTVRTLGSGAEPTIEIGADGNPVIAFRTANGVGGLKFVACDDPFCSTSSTRTLDSTEGAGQDWSSIAIGRDGNPVIAYYVSTLFSLRVAACLDPSCDSLVIRDIDGGNPWSDRGPNPSVVIGLDGNPVVSYQDYTNQDLRVAACTDPTCENWVTTQMLTTNNDGAFSSMVIGPNGFPIIAHYDSTTTALVAQYCGNARCTIFGTQILLDGQGDVGRYPSINIDLLGNVIVSYYDTTNFDLRFVRCPDRACSTPTVSNLTPGPVYGGRYSTLALDPVGRPVITHTHSLLVFLTQCLDPGCGTSTTVTLDHDATSISSTVRRSGQPIVVFHNNASSTVNLFDVWWAGGGR